ncbi:type I restriction-modification system methyltransferase subunit [Bernardetia litoralis DSM 6794]|uniref:site-specific DNA-methyltransferase (adenine-specific) n=1 Tax=Bernardetia litoralis (strain ATCC 23117 / DSM 6794 / NBRC 15988 / NCIMB 1366 / Fx l1 / Sio-4) TaxID=880071 RepID=I4APN7_BERLS|nr:N-6 DNA methylase [Bernardetia litoralis]AFM05922.1 type I restriction-modification system methyltransferase subunit [Bernardetia litoralis DSM 6794]
MSLFQKSVLKNYIKFLPKEKVEAAWQAFSAHFQNPIIQENIRASKEEEYQEGFLNDFFVNVFGYVKKPNVSYNLTTELKNVKNAKKTDGALLRSDGNPFAVIELKGMDTTDLTKVEAQAFGYKNNQYNCTYVIISNFEKLRFYIDNAIDFEEFNLFTITRERFEVLYFCLSLQTLLVDDKPKKAKEETLNREEEITKKLYNDYADFRNTLFKNIQLLNPEYDKLTLFKKTQKLLDRFLFIFFAEDKGLLDTKLIAYIIDEWREINEKHGIPTSLYDKYKRYFHFLYTGKKSRYHNIFPYNGGLFKTDELLDSLKIDDALLARHTLKISEYDFDSDVSVNILGHIFEHSLNDFEEIQAEIEGKELEKTNTRRKKDGVFYTPKYITKYIVDNTVGKLCQDKKQELELLEQELEKNYEVENGKPIKNKKKREELHQKIEDYKKWVSELTICDPACGSGAFLNQVLEFLIAEHHYIYELELKFIGTALIDKELENKILKNNIFGVDINEESVEIAKLSLWLRTAYKGRKLTTLNDNIKCGNSLIDDPKIAGQKAFNWKNEFPSIFEKGGFDVVVGNPPYGAKLSKEHQNYLNEKYIKGGSETVISFLKLSYELLKSKRYLSFIIPKSFSFSSNYKYIRKFLIEDIFEIVDCKRVWTEVKLEQVIVSFLKNNNSKSYSSLVREDKSILEVGTIQKTDVELFDFYLNGISNEELQIGKKLLETEQFLNDIATNNRGGIFQKLITDKGNTEVLGGAEIQRYGIVGIKGKVNKTAVQDNDRVFINSNSVLVQNIIAHITQPTDHIKITACLPSENTNYVIVDTINQITLNSDYEDKFIWVLLNSPLINWYSYRFIFGKAIRTMHFDNAVTSRIPIPKITKEAQKPFIELANKMLSLNEDFAAKKNRFLRRLEENFKLDKLSKKLDSFYDFDFSVHKAELKKKKIELSFKQQDEWQDYFEDYKKDLLALQSQIQSTDNQIDNLVFELYGLTEEEIKLIQES